MNSVEFTLEGEDEPFFHHTDRIGLYILPLKKGEKVWIWECDHNQYEIIDVEHYFGKGSNYILSITVKKI